MCCQRLCALGLICLIGLLSGSAGPARAQQYVLKDSLTAQGDGIPRITAEELLSDLRLKKAVLLDVRVRDAYKQRHIKGALNIPVDQVHARLKELPRGKFIATYCS